MTNIYDTDIYKSIQAKAYMILNKKMKNSMPQITPENRITILSYVDSTIATILHDYRLLDEYCNCRAYRERGHTVIKAINGEYHEPWCNIIQMEILDGKRDRRTLNILEE